MTADDAQQPSGATPAELAEVVQRAAGAVAARHRGDLGDAEMLLESLGDDPSRAAAFFVLSELSLSLLVEHTGQTWDECLQELTLSLASTQPPR